MNIYFTASTFQATMYQESYDLVVKTLKDLGHTVMFRQISFAAFAQREKMTDEERRAYYRAYLQKVTKSQMVIIEMSYPSTVNLGHEMSVALERGKPTLCLYMEGKGSAFLGGIVNDKLMLKSYTLETLPAILEEAVAQAQNHSDSRFNFFISPKHINFLDFISRKRKIPKSVYLRELIERDKSKNGDFTEEK